jgi:hypothetical protein
MRLRHGFQYCALGALEAEVSLAFCSNLRVWCRRRTGPAEIERERERRVVEGCARGGVLRSTQKRKLQRRSVGGLEGWRVS